MILLRILVTKIQELTVSRVSLQNKCKSDSLKLFKSTSFIRMNGSYQAHR